MKCTIPEISWHNREPVLSVDIFPENGNFYRLASAGGDCHVLIWQMIINENGAVSQEVISDLTRHQRAVNCVRWSNSGQFLASGDDDANIIIWQLKTDNIPLLEGDTGDREVWNVYKIMRGHKEDVYDICWSVDESKILSGSVDNTAILWDVKRGKMDHILSDHKGFVQGVAWDPKNQIIATISTDRICRIFDPLGKHVKARIQKGKLSVPDKHFLKDKEVKFFHDDTFKSFFRRLDFSPDGSLLIVPSGHIEAENCKIPLNATLIFTLDNFTSPAAILPLPHQSSTVVRCCPILFELHEKGPEPVVKLPYRMIFAVATDHDIILYDTQQTVPFARFQDMHYTRLTDLTWSKDGLLLIASSTDGFCSLVTFEIDELGVPWVKMESETESNPLNVSGCEELDKDENIDTTNKAIKVEDKLDKLKEDVKEESKKRPSFLEQWAIKTPKKIKLSSEEERKSVCAKNDNEVVEILDSPEKKSGEKMEVKLSEQNKKETVVNKLIPRRITPLEVNKTQSNISKPEEKINILVPKRIKPVAVQQLPSTSKTEDDSSSTSQKRSTNNDEEVSKLQSDSENDAEDSSDSEAEKLSKEELEELHKASENIREFFSGVPRKTNSHSDIKPIEIRRKPRESNTVQSQNSLDAKPIKVRRKPMEVQKNVTVGNSVKVENGTQSSSDAQPIEVRRKPRELHKDLSDNLEKTSVDADIKTKCLEEKGSSVEDNKLGKPLDIEQKLGNQGDRSMENIKEQCPEKKIEANKGEKNSTPSKTLTVEKAKESNDIICLSDSDQEIYNTTPKKSKSVESKNILEEAPPKIKVSSLVKRKGPEKTPKKTNALLSFLQKSSEKKTNKKKVTNQAEKCIDLSLEENGARDAWKCDAKLEEKEKKKKSEEVKTAVTMDDDKTEDFCLQLEDSQEGCEDDKKESQSVEKQQGGKEAIKNVEISQQGTNVSMKELAPSSSSGPPKTPRRVPLITLASPKGARNRHQ